jgi:hypothetical protein
MLLQARFALMRLYLHGRIQRNTHNAGRTHQFFLKFFFVSLSVRISQFIKPCTPYIVGELMYSPTSLSGSTENNWNETP